MRIKLHQLDVLLEVAAQGSLSKAARTLHLTQPAISKTIQEIESEIGMPILDRSSRGVTLNDYGQVLLRHARDIDRSLSQAREEIDSLLGQSLSQLRVGFTSAAAYGPFTTTLLHFQQRFPTVKLIAMEARPHQLYEALENNRIDLAVISATTGMRIAPMYWEILYALGNTLIAGRHHPVTHRVALRHLLDYTWLDWDEPGEHSILAQVFRRYNLPLPSQIVHCSSPWIMARMLDEAPMVSMWTSVRLRFPDYQERLRPLSLKEVLPATSIGILCPDIGRLSRAGHAFIDMLRVNSRDWLQQREAHEMVVREE
ncbi:LysR family transcriptional regulator [Pantoea latae]|jgi:LysR family transcriptional regulator, regulator of abg operon|uniref:LysR family transcriptional regulator n=1 Tax=Pantoea latae TaxID=1964541 RepID=A0A1V9DH82_9GAMM|nr:LysR family transcriptional regulator [Pantoea latae]OQP33229.1 LysR family transcriptional regulator [Pantoea latae]